ncbi:efflux RND transporter periplasmic adaptor subunit, partial [Herbaspirillum sp. HC18]
MDRNPCSAGNRKGRSTAGRLAHGALAGALLLAAGLAGCKQDERTAELPQPVRVMVVRPEAQSSTFSYAGIVRARYESDLGFRVGGKIVERLVNIGDPVASGQVL